MSTLDASQLQVLRLDVSRHARVLGAPGTGKTLALVEAFAALGEQHEWRDADVLALAPTRLAASDLRTRIERRVQRAFGGTPARTAASLAFSLLQRASALEGVAAPRLLTGTAQDEIIGQVIQQAIDGELRLAHPSPFSPEVLRGEAFRAELRELARVLDDFHLDPEQLVGALHERVHGSNADDPSADLVGQWRFALELLHHTRMSHARQRPDELSSSALMRAACEMVQRHEQIALPKLILIDDAQEVGEGALALLAVLASRGTKVWAFGDPDIATSTFQGEPARMLAGVHAELARRGVEFAPREAEEQVVILAEVHRHGTEIREVVRTLTERIGAAGAGQQRAAQASADESSEGREKAVRFATVATPSEQVGAIGHWLRARHLGVAGGTPLAWHEMAVVCRTRSEAARIAKLLAAGQVPTDVAAGGLVLREHQLVRELIRLLQHALGLQPLTSTEVHELLSGVVGGIDPIALRRLRSALRLQEVRAAHAEARPAEHSDRLIFEAFQFAAEVPVLDMWPARRLRDFARLAASAQAEHAAGATPREVLWRLWSGTGLADALQTHALEGKGARADEANRALDAVMGLFFALQRHEEQDSTRPIADVLEELLTSAVPSDTLAQRSARGTVTVGTPQSLIGREFALVAVAGLQDGIWPNMRARGSLFGVTALQRWLRDGAALAPTRRDTLHDELRLFAQAVSRARTQVLAVAIANEDQHPSVFFALGNTYREEQPLPSGRLTLRGVVAEMRRRLVRDLNDAEALDALTQLAKSGVPGAHPDEWYGVLPSSTDAPLQAIDADVAAQVSVSPSQIEQAEECPLNWVISRLGAGRSNYRANLGTLLHHALETVEEPVTTEKVLARVHDHWDSLHFDAEWQQQRAAADAEKMAQAVVDYLRDFSRSGQSLLATEAPFEVRLGAAKLRGTADRLEAHQRNDGIYEVTVVDLKTGRQKPSARETAQHAQLQAYQLGVTSEAFSTADGTIIEGVSVGAKLVYVHPDVLGKTQLKKGETFTEIVQDPLTENQQYEFEQRVQQVARVMADSTFIAQVEHHCENGNTPGRSCALHIIPAVSHA